MKIQESVVDDEKLFREYFAAARIAKLHLTAEQASIEATRMVDEHRKLFPKKFTPE